MVTRFLAPGFPAADSDGTLKDIQAYDCDAAKALMAKAGFPDGKGFPDQELKLRGESDAVAARFIASAASISKCLNIKITVNNIVSMLNWTYTWFRPDGRLTGRDIADGMTHTLVTGLERRSKSSSNRSGSRRGRR